MEHVVQFPITDDPDKWAKAKWRIKPLSDDAKRVICAAQPYQRGDDLVRSPLRLLRELDDADKHRLIAPGFVGVSQGRIRIVPPIIPIAYEVPKPEVGLENNTKIAWVLFSEPQPDLNVNFNVSLAVGVTHEAMKEGFTWTTVGQVVSSIGNEVTDVLLKLSALP
jgi:hypothetical protein